MSAVKYYTFIGEVKIYLALPCNFIFFSVEPLYNTVTLHFILLTRISAVIYKLICHTYYV
jgi:hypothetical protein